MPLQLDYYYGNEAEQYSFYRIPKTLFTDPHFKGLSVEARVLYGMLLDRMALSIKNRWLDQAGRVYIIYTIAEVMETIGCAEQKANRLLSELDSARGMGLIERVRRGLGRPNMIYVKNFTIRPQSPPVREDAPIEPVCPETPGDPEEPWEAQIRNCENHKSGNVETTSQEMRKSQTNNTDLNKTNLSETDRDPSIYPIHPAGASPVTVDLVDNPFQAHGRAKAEDGMDAYRSLIRENISYDILLIGHPYDRERIDGFVELMAEACCSARKTIRVNQEDVCAGVVRGRLMQLDSSHIEYVMGCLDRNTTPVGNVRAYILSALFNAPVTISQYYASLVSHDMACGPGG